MDKDRYKRFVGRLIYLSYTRPDIAYVVSVFIQFMHSPSKEHMEAENRILRYLNTSPGRGLLCAKRSELKSVGYTDADWKEIRLSEDPHLGTLPLLEVI